MSTQHTAPDSACSGYVNQSRPRLSQICGSFTCSFNSFDRRVCSHLDHFCYEVDPDDEGTSLRHASLAWLVSLVGTPVQECHF